MNFPFIIDLNRELEEVRRQSRIIIGIGEREKRKYRPDERKRITYLHSRERELSIEIDEYIRKANAGVI